MFTYVGTSAPPGFNVTDPEDYVLTVGSITTVGPTSPSYFFYDNSIEALCLRFTSQTAIGPILLGEGFMIEVFSDIVREDDFTFTLEVGDSFNSGLISPTYFEVIHAEGFTIQPDCLVPEPRLAFQALLWALACCRACIFRS